MAFSRFTHRAALAGLAAVLVVALTGCTSSRFDFGIRDSSEPRVSVIHRPLHPEVGEPFQIVARYESRSVMPLARITVSVVYPSGNADQTCTPSGRTEGECVLDVPGGAPRKGIAFYNAEISTRGSRQASPGTYRFLVGPPDASSPDGERIVPLRVPLEQADRMLQVLLVPDRRSFAPTGGLDFERFLGAIEDRLYDGLLEDPAYRWRDDQIGFFATDRVGVVTDYDSGDASRCGGNPWPGVAESGLVDLAAETGFADVIGVLHTRGFRDCAGIGTTTSGTSGGGRHFGADITDAGVFQHELGHALFSLGDEYREETASRRASGGVGLGLDSCCCVPEGTTPGDGPLVPGLPGDPTTGGGVTTGPTIVPKDGFFGSVPICPGLDASSPACGELLDPACYPAPSACPPIASSCAWPNIFTTRAACEDAVDAAASHPAIDLAPSPGDCRLLCSPETRPCPCTPERTVWIMDRRTPPASGAPDDDIMGELDPQSPAERHGPACVLCIETELCLLWERGSDRSGEQAREYCRLPP